MRQIHVDEDLSGQTLEGPARESLFRNCNLDGAVFVGDWRGTDYFANSCLGTDWSQAGVYGSYWRGNTVTDAVFPTDIGHLHHEPIAEIFRQSLPRFRGADKKIAEKLPPWATQDYVGNSWDTTYDRVVKDLPGGTKQKTVDVLKKLVEGYPNLSKRARQLEDDLLNDRPLWTPPEDPFNVTLLWPEYRLTVDLTQYDNRHDAARDVEAIADREDPKQEHHVFVISLFPANARVLKRHWLERTFWGL